MRALSCTYAPLVLCLHPDRLVLPVFSSALGSQGFLNFLLTLAA